MEEAGQSMILQMLLKLNSLVVGIQMEDLSSFIYDWQIVPAFKQLLPWTAFPFRRLTTLQNILNFH